MRKLKLLILTLMVCTVTVCHSQTLNQSLNFPNVKQLQSQGVDTIIVYTNSVAPSYYFRSITNNYKFASEFVLWRKNGKSYFYFNGPGAIYPIHQLPTNEVWAFYLVHQSIIDTERFVKPLVSTSTSTLRR